MDVTDLSPLFAAITRAHAARLELASDRARRDLTEHVLPGQPDLDVVCLLRGKAHIASTQRDHAIMQPEPPQHLLRAGEHALVLVPALLRCRDRDEFHLRELVLADHAARVLAGC